MQFLDVLKILVPVVLALVPGARPYIDLIVSAIALAEFSGLPGADKKAIALEAIRLGAETANRIANKIVVDPVKAVDYANRTIDLIVGLVNLLTKKKV